MAINLPAVHNHGRWIVSCPWCNGAQPASEEFLCAECHNEAVGGEPMPVAWPTNRAAIEELLMARPQPSTRNWTPAETVKDLARENTEHGI